jgi:hypothetical protein
LATDLDVPEDKPFDPRDAQSLSPKAHRHSGRASLAAGGTHLAAQRGTQIVKQRTRPNNTVRFADFEDRIGLSSASRRTSRSTSRNTSRSTSRSTSRNTTSRNTTSRSTSRISGSSAVNSTRNTTSASRLTTATSPRKTGSSIISNVEMYRATHVANADVERATINVNAANSNTANAANAGITNNAANAGTNNVNQANINNTTSQNSATITNAQDDQPVKLPEDYVLNYEEAEDQGHPISDRVRAQVIQSS